MKDLPTSIINGTIQLYNLTSARGMSLFRSTLGLGFGTENDVENFLYLECSFGLCAPELVFGRNEFGEGNSLSNFF
jgi:hypothetical protein